MKPTGNPRDRNLQIVWNMIFFTPAKLGRGENKQLAINEYVPAARRYALRGGLGTMPGPLLHALGHCNGICQGIRYSV